MSIEFAVVAVVAVVLCIFLHQLQTELQTPANSLLMCRLLDNGMEKKMYTMNIKQTIDPCTMLTGHGFTLDKAKSTQNGRIMRRDDSKLLVMRGDNGNWVVTDMRAGKSGSVLDLMMWLTGCSLVEAKNRLQAVNCAPTPDISFSIPQKQSPNTAPLSLDTLAQATRATANLAERGIGDWVQHPLFLGKVLADQRGNACFPHYDDNGPCGWEIKNAGFTGFASGGHKGLWFSNRPAVLRRLVLTESAIDAMSYQAIHGGDDVRYLSFGGGIGRNQIGLITRAIERSPPDCVIVLAVDNDAAGKGYIQQIEALANGCRRVQVHQPTTGKDWNEALCKPQPEQAANESEPAYRCWLVWYRDRDPDSVTCCPPATNAEILAHHPGAVAAEPLATEP